MTESETAGSGRVGHVNEVRLVGRLSGLAVPRLLRNGMAIVTWRLTVRRPALRAIGSGFDTIDCFAWAPTPRRYAPAWRLGDIIACEGALRRRFWRSATGTMSRSEVEVERAHRVARAGRQPSPP